MKKTKINLVDKFLFIIMIMLLLFNMSTMFIEIKRNYVTAQIDIAMRTAVASIFGYFISTNFANQLSKYTLDKYVVSDKIVQELPTNNNNTDFNLENKIDSLEVLKSDNTPKDTKTDLVTNKDDLESEYLLHKKNEVQVSIISIISIFCIVFFFIIRNFTTLEKVDAALISQFRDIICGSIGFLIGMPAKENKKEKT